MISNVLSVKALCKAWQGRIEASFVLGQYDVLATRGNLVYSFMGLERMSGYEEVKRTVSVMDLRNYPDPNHTCKDMFLGFVYHINTR